MNVLIIGAGAVGLPYGYHISQGGGSVGFLVKESQIDTFKNGITLNQLAKLGPNKRIKYTDFQLFSSLEAIKEKTWDYIFIAIPTPAQTTDWLNQLKIVSGKACIVVLQTDPVDSGLYASIFGKDYLMRGLISLISFQTYEQNDHFAFGEVNYWLTPGGYAYFTGERQHSQKLVDVMNKGKMPARWSENLAGAAFSEAVMMPLIGALEVADWRFKKLVQKEYLEPAIAAVKEALNVCAKIRGHKPPFAFRIFTSFMFIKYLILMAPFFTPFPLESYLQYHFEKVRNQTISFLKSFINAAKNQSQDFQSIEKLLLQMNLRVRSGTGKSTNL